MNTVVDVATLKVSDLPNENISIKAFQKSYFKCGLASRLEIFHSVPVFIVIAVTCVPLCVIAIMLCELAPLAAVLP